MPDQRERELMALFRKLPDRDKTELLKIAEQWVMMNLRKNLKEGHPR